MPDMRNNTMSRKWGSIPGKANLLLFLVLLAGLVLVKTCKFPYDADVDELSGLLVIEGGIVKGDTVQTITVSRSAPLSAPQVHPVSGCDVSVLDEDVTEFIFSESKDGVYTALITEDMLEYNRNYFVRVVTPNGNIYESDFEEMLPAAPVDSIYFLKEDVPQENGLLATVNQFYIDLKGTEDESRYYMWKLSETFEYHSSARADYMYVYYDNVIFTDSISIHDTIVLPDTIIIIDTSWVEIRHYVDSIVPEPVYYPDSIYTCWLSSGISGLYTSSTINLTENAKKRIPLHAIPLKNDKLNVKYSLLVKQYSLTPDAYAFWNMVKIETEETGGLYTQQPGQVESNLHCVSDENEKVLGYFWASSVSTKRIFVTSSTVARYTYPYCELYLVEDRSLFTEFPTYIMYIAEYGLEYTTEQQKCMNCLLRGGVNSRPDYWDDESVTVLTN